MTEPAARHSWQTLTPPIQRETFDLPLQFTKGEADRLRQGLIPGDMNDRWFIFFEDDWLYFHRSWTGDCIFGVRLNDISNGVRVVEAWASRDEGSYKSPGLEQEKRLVMDLISMCLRR